MTEQPRPSGAVFLSYASEDADAAARICEARQLPASRCGSTEANCAGGDAWDSQIKKQIHDCALFVPLISAHTNARIEGYFRGEWNLATRRLVNRAHDAAFLMPVVIDETREANARVPEEFFRAQWTRLPGGETPPAFAKSCAPVAGLGSRPCRRGEGSDKLKQSSPAPKIPVLHGHAVRRWCAGSDFPSLRWCWLWVVERSGISKLRAIRLLPSRNLFRRDLPCLLRYTISRSPCFRLPICRPKRIRSTCPTVWRRRILNLLVQAPDLKVIARTSSFAFKGQNMEVAEIAKRLDVTHVLEGSVRKSGNNLRITAQLVRTSDSTHLWSQTYDRPLDDIFGFRPWPPSSPCGLSIQR